MKNKNNLALQKTFKPRTINQNHYVNSIENNVLTICYGCAGTGKTAVACGMAVNKIISGEINKIFITRPLVQCGRNGGGIGFLRGDVYNKIYPFMFPIIGEIENFIGPIHLKNFLKSEIIEVAPLELCRGRTFENTFMILDECQNISYEQMKMFLTRIGKNSKCILTGDIEQKDVRDDAFDRVINNLRGVNNVGICKLELEDIQRHPIVQEILEKL